MNRNECRIYYYAVKYWSETLDFGMMDIDK